MLHACCSSVLWVVSRYGGLIAQPDPCHPVMSKTVRAGLLYANRSAPITPIFLTSPNAERSPRFSASAAHDRL